MALHNDHKILEIGDQTEHVTFQKSHRATKCGFELPMLLHDRLAFSPEEFLRRYEMIQSAMEAQGLDALLIRGPENITYFSGYEVPRVLPVSLHRRAKGGEPCSWSGISNGSTRPNSRGTRSSPRSTIGTIRLPSRQVLPSLGLTSASGSAWRSNASSIRSTSTRRWSANATVRIPRRDTHSLGCPDDQIAGRG